MLMIVNKKEEIIMRVELLRLKINELCKKLESKLQL
jgi:hypothetical protein